MSKKTYNHAFSICFEIGGSINPQGEDITAEQIYNAIVRRAQDALKNNELLKAVGQPYDSFLEESADPRPKD